jgi:tetratricopeptide (TPR) repeat protein/protein-tyrosine phosphatase
MKKTKTSQTDPIRVDFISDTRFPVLNRLGLTFAPGKKRAAAFTVAWDRDLPTDLHRLFNEYEVGTLISLLEDQEIADLQMVNFADECDRAKIDLVRFPIRDVSIPGSMEAFLQMVTNAVDLLKHGETVVAHCKGGLGRAGTVAACIAVAATDAKISAAEAIELVREARPGAIETDAQVSFIAEFEKEWRELIASRGNHYLLYWQERSVIDHASNELPLDVVASNGLFGVEAGDTLWIVTLTQDRELFLAGRLIVGEIVEYEEAMRRMPDAGLWQTEYYAFPEPGTEEFIRPIPLTEIAEQLRFDDENDRLTIRDGQINPQQLRKRRKLTPESAELVTDLWNESDEPDEITDPEELITAWQEIVEANPDEPEPHYNLAVALDQAGRIDEAILEYQTTIHLDPNYFPALYNLGNLATRSQQYDEAIEMFNRAILVDGDYAPVHFMLGVAYFESGRFDDAVAATRQGLEIDPDDESAYYNIAYWTFSQGDYRGAIALCDEVIARFPYYTSPHVLKGLCFRDLGEIENEIRSYKDALDIQVDDEGEVVFSFTALFFLGAAWERNITGSDDGIEYIQADFHFDMEDPTHQFCFAMGHLALGEREYADDCIENLRTSAPALAHRLERAMNQ